jgi:hypothetical protein
MNLFRAIAVARFNLVKSGGIVRDPISGRMKPVYPDTASHEKAAAYNVLAKFHKSAASLSDFVAQYLGRPIEPHAAEPMGENSER